MTLRALLLALLCLIAGAASAHGCARPISNFAQTDAETYDVLWKVPARGDDLARPVRRVAGGDGQPDRTARRPWIVAFAFGLLHGFGFAGALHEIGLPQTDILLALLFLNIGVEVGQLVFIAAMLAVIALARRIPVALPAWAWRVPPYAIGAVASFWLIERLVAFGP